jgi:hypothetical protein
LLCPHCPLFLPFPPTHVNTMTKDDINMPVIFCQAQLGWIWILCKCAAIFKTASFMNQETRSFWEKAKGEKSRDAALLSSIRICCRDFKEIHRSGWVQQNQNENGTAEGWLLRLLSTYSTRDPCERSTGIGWVLFFRPIRKELWGRLSTVLRTPHERRIHLANAELPNAELPNAELLNAELPNVELLNAESYRTPNYWTPNVIERRKLTNAEYICINMTLKMDMDRDTDMDMDFVHVHVRVTVHVHL